MRQKQQAIHVFFRIIQVRKGMSIVNPMQASHPVSGGKCHAQPPIIGGPSDLDMTHQIVHEPILTQKNNKDLGVDQHEAKSGSL
jgi:hypothetical protein